MRLDPSYLKFITKDEMRVLLAVEMGMRNHEWVPVQLIERISKLKRASAFQNLRLLLKNKLVCHMGQKYDGYKLTYLGYDYLALHSFMKRGTVKKVVGKIGVGKESDIYLCKDDNDNSVVLKFARLGRISFRSVKKNRDYLKHRQSFNWLYLSRLASIKEYCFMEALYKKGFPTPVPIDWNRHGIVMSLLDAYTMSNVREMENPHAVFDQCMDLIKRLAECGLIHSDFNEFNLMISLDEKVTMIDFPQMVSTRHLNADFYFNRDVQCIHNFFEKKFLFNSKYTLDLNDIVRESDLDNEVKASGFIKKGLGENVKDLDILDNYEQIKQDDLEENGQDESEENGKNEDECFSEGDLEEKINQINLEDLEKQKNKKEDEEEEKIDEAENDEINNLEKDNIFGELDESDIDPISESEEEIGEEINENQEDQEEQDRKLKHKSKKWMTEEERQKFELEKKKKKEIKDKTLQEKVQMHVEKQYNKSNETKFKIRRKTQKTKIRLADHDY